MRKHFPASLTLSALLLSAFAGIAPAWAQAPAIATHVDPSPGETLAKDAAEYRTHISILANEFMEGRAPGTKGNRMAADYIEFQLKKLGMVPAFATAGEGKPGSPRTSWRQEFTAPSSSARPSDIIHLKEQLVGYAGKGVVAEPGPALTPGTDFNVLGYSASGDATGTLAFAGYAIEEGEKGYTSFPEGADLKGKIAVVLRFEPMNENGESRWADVRWSVNAGLDSKLRAAAERGASAVILVNAPGAHDDRVNKLEDLTLSGGRPLKIPVVMMSIPAADAMIKAADEQGRSLMDLRKLADEAGGVIDLPRVAAQVKVDMERVPLKTDNVGGILPGVGDLAKEYVVIGSHYDHVGYGFFGSRSGAAGRGKIHAGADDNASGTCGNLLTARKLAEAYAALPPETPRRSVLFLWFSAEESGLVGSRHYVNNPIEPLDTHALMLNMDMIGRLREGKLEVGGVGTSPGLSEWLEPYFATSGMVIKPTRIGAPNSDHYSFHLKGVPNLFFFTGLQDEYHTVKDLVPTINVDGAAQVADMVYRIALDAATRTEPFKHSAAKEEDDDKPSQGPLGGITVRFGIMPGNYSDDKPGVLIEGLSGTDLPAAKAGLQAGDRLMKWNGQEIESVEGWMKYLAQAKPGDVVKVTYTRKVDGVEKEMTADVTLTAAPSNRRQ